MSQIKNFPSTSPRVNYSMFAIEGQLIMPQTTVVQLSFQSTSYYSTLSEKQPGEGSGI